MNTDEHRSKDDERLIKQRPLGAGCYHFLISVHRCSSVARKLLISGPCFLVHRALPGKATLVFAKSRLRNLARHRKQIVTQAPRHGPYLRSTCACAAAQGHQAKGTLLAIGVAIPFIPLIPVSYCFINRDAGDEGDGPLQVGESCLDLAGLWRAPRQSAKNLCFGSHPRRFRVGGCLLCACGRGGCWGSCRAGWPRRWCLRSSSWSSSAPGRCSRARDQPAASPPPAGPRGRGR